MKGIEEVKTETKLFTVESLRIGFRSAVREKNGVEESFVANVSVNIRSGDGSFSRFLVEDVSEMEALKVKPNALISLAEELLARAKGVDETSLIDLPVVVETETEPVAVDKQPKDK